MKFLCSKDVKDDICVTVNNQISNVHIKSC